MSTTLDSLIPAIAGAGIAVILASAAAAIGYASRFDKTPQHTSKLTGQEWVDELLDGHDGRFYNELGMHKHVFQKLLKVLQRMTGFDDTKHISAEEQLSIFLHFARRALSNRGLQERFQRSGDTISKCACLSSQIDKSSDVYARTIHRVLDALTSGTVHGAYMKLPTSETSVPDEIRDSPKFFPWFKDCIGALDGTHIAAFVPEASRASFRNRKGHVSQNVLAASSMDMLFLYVLPGWEGSASDSRVLEDARATSFKVPHGRYYLADAGYGGSDVVMVPYRGVRYHLKEWGTTKQRYASSRL
jgi:hypothetical protein